MNVFRHIQRSFFNSCFLEWKLKSISLSRSLSIFKRREYVDTISSDPDAKETSIKHFLMENQD